MILLHLGVIHGTQAQLFNPDLPISWRVEGIVSEQYPTESLPAVDVNALLEEDLDNYQNKTEGFRFAYKHVVDFSTDSHGRWKTLANGDRIWRMAIRSEEALALNVTFDRFYLDKGAKVYVYNEDHSEVIGPLTGANNKPTGYLGITHLSGDFITIELYEPFAARGNNVLSIKNVAHMYRHFDENTKRFGLSHDCNIDLECVDQTDLSKKSSSVVLITIDDGTRWITGTLMNNTNQDGRPLLLTSFKGLVGNSEAWIIHFNYKSEDCGANAEKTPLLGRSLSGARVLASSQQKGFALLELFDLPPFDWNIHLAGWSRNTTRTNKTFCIHHPGGDVKKIAESDQSAEFIDGNYYINWTSGRTEKGSLGAPLFNDSGQVVGWLSGGNAQCDNNMLDVFTSIEQAWEGSFSGDRLRDWLDPGQSDKPNHNLYFPVTAYFEEERTSSELVVYPIPSTGIVNAFFVGDENILFTGIYDLQGRLVRGIRGEKNLFNLSSLSRGTYILIVQSEKGLSQKKIILE